MRPDGTCFCVQEKHLLGCMRKSVDFIVSPSWLCLTVKYQYCQKGAFAEKDISAPHLFRVILFYLHLTEALLTALL